MQQNKHILLQKNVVHKIYAKSYKEKIIRNKRYSRLVDNILSSKTDREVFTYE